MVDHIELLRSVIARVKKGHPFTIDAMVILPEHLHAIWTLPQGDSDYATRWRLIKGSFFRGLDKIEFCRNSRQKKRERGIWQRRYWEHLIRDDTDYARHVDVDYIHYNPVKHSYVTKASDWPFSSIHRLISAGVLDKEWGIAIGENSGFGER